jgi:hypothetical protein
LCIWLAPDIGAFIGHIVHSALIHNQCTYQVKFNIIHYVEKYRGKFLVS